eukprot:7375972-Prymnesium_polylepis.1
MMDPQEDDMEGARPKDAEVGVADADVVDHAHKLMARRARYAERRAGKRKVQTRNREAKSKKMCSLLDGEVFFFCLLCRDGRGV